MIRIDAMSNLAQMVDVFCGIEWPLEFQIGRAVRRNWSSVDGGMAVPVLVKGPGPKPATSQRANAPPHQPSPQ